MSSRVGWRVVSEHDYGPHRAGDAPSTVVVARGFNRELELERPRELLEQRRQVNERAWWRALEARAVLELLGDAGAVLALALIPVLLLVIGTKQ